MKAKTQKEAVLEYLKTHKKGLSQQDAYRIIGTTRLGAIIFILRQEGWDIETVDCKAKTRFGHACRYGKYVLKGRK